MLSLLSQAITWGLLLVFAGFVIFGLCVAGIELFRFYAREIQKLRPSLDRD